MTTTHATPATTTLTLGVNHDNSAAALAAEDSRVGAELRELRMLRAAGELHHRDEQMLAGDAAARSERARARIAATGGLAHATTHDLATWATVPGDDADHDTLDELALARLDLQAAGLL